MSILPTSTRELDCRHNDGIDVRLLWREHDNRVFVAVHDTKTGEMFCLKVRDGERPLDVFHHPYAYAAPSRSARTAPRGINARGATGQRSARDAGPH